MEDPSRGRLFGGGLEALWGRALPQIGKMRFGSCAWAVAFPPSSKQAYIADANPWFILLKIEQRFKKDKPLKRHYRK